MKDGYAWIIILDRFGDESRAKGGQCSIIETADLIIEKYKLEKVKPKVIVSGIGLGAALHAYLVERSIPCELLGGGLALLSRVGGADIYRYKEVIP